MAPMLFAPAVQFARRLACPLRALSVALSREAMGGLRFKHCTLHKGYPTRSAQYKPDEAERLVRESLTVRRPLRRCHRLGRHFRSLCKNMAPDGSAQTAF
eukprot:SAG31_NODE_3051_length_4742_cov_35.992031_6_plen_100_part_00